MMPNSVQWSCYCKVSPCFEFFFINAIVLDHGTCCFCILPLFDLISCRCVLHEMILTCTDWLNTAFCVFLRIKKKKKATWPMATQFPDFCKRAMHEVMQVMNCWKLPDFVGIPRTGVFLKCSWKLQTFLCMLYSIRGCISCPNLTLAPTFYS